MSFEVHALPDSPTTIKWSVYTANDFNDAIVVSLTILSRERLSSKEDAVTHLAAVLHSNAPWLVTADDDYWTISFDLLRETIPDATQLPAWAVGVRTIDPPGIRPGMLFVSNGMSMAATGEDYFKTLPLHQKFYGIDCDFYIGKTDVIRSIRELQVAETPAELTSSLDEFRRDHPAGKPTAFIMMQFGSTEAHRKLTEAIRTGLSNIGVTALRADDKQYHDDLYWSVLTYVHGCDFGVAVFERLENDDINPNASFEVGYSLAIGKKVCLLKDKTLKALQTDLVGKLYKPFDPQDPTTSIPPLVQKWVMDWKDRIGLGASVGSFTV